jgi:hypothetical protein
MTNEERILLNVKVIVIEASIKSELEAVFIKRFDTERIDCAVERVIEVIKGIDVYESEETAFEVLDLLEPITIAFSKVTPSAMQYADDALLTVFNKLMDLIESALIAIESDFKEGE